MKILVISGCNQNGIWLEKVLRWAKSKGILLVIDIGEFHGPVDFYKKFDVYATCWEGGYGILNEDRFDAEILKFKGRFARDGDSIIVANRWFLLNPKNIGIDYMPESVCEKIETRLSGDSGGEIFVLFRDGGLPFLSRVGKLIIFNPGSVCKGRFAVIDTDGDTVELLSLSDVS